MPSPSARVASSRIAIAFVGTALVVVACGRDVSRREKMGHVSEDLIAQEQLYTGSDLPAKQLALTFDDGPGPASVTNDLSAYLKSRPTPIHATFFVNGACIATTALPNSSCGTPTPNATSVMAQVIADGHMIGNHTTTHRDLVTEVPNAQRVEELADTDALIAPYQTWNRLLFRAPYGSWTGPVLTPPAPPADEVYTTISASAMNKYIGPIYWWAGGGPTDTTRAADWECWQVKSYTTKQCGDLYLNEIHTLNKGIVLMHDAKCGPSNCNNLTNHNLTSGIGNTVDMVKYLVPILEGEGYTFKALDEIPAIAAALPACDASCATCAGPSASQCTSCGGGKYLSGGGTCNTCSTCTGGAGTYQTAACTATTDTVCSACATCSTGTYASGACTPTTNTVCAACDASCTACSGGGPSACTACAGGKYLSNGTCNVCTVCGSGKYPSAACTQAADTVCDACHATCTTCSGPDITQCGSCPSGYYLDGGSCKACTTCAAGSYQSTACATTADTACTPCAVGTFADVAGATTCAGCAAGTFASTTGATKCTTCSCDDNDACTADSCSPTTGCTHAPIAGCGSSSSSGSSGTSGTSGTSSTSGTSGTSSSSSSTSSSTSGDPSSSGASTSASGDGGGGESDKGCSASGARGRSKGLASAVLVGALALVLRRRRRS